VRLARWPIDGAATITSGYGVRVHPVTGETRHHNGIDLAVPVGTPVRAAQGGYVHAVDTVGAGVAGYWVRLVHGAGEGESTLTWTTYCHLSEVSVVQGQPVRAGDVVGLSGGAKGAPGAGRSTGPHLHFSVWEGVSARRDVDPLLHLPML